MTVHGYGVSFWGNGNVPELGSGGVYKALCLY